MKSRPLRVIVAHNTYEHRGGEDAVMEAEVALLRSSGHEVALYTRSNDELADMGRGSLAAQAIYSTRTQADFATLFSRFRPDILHVHNTVPLISPSIFWAAHQAGVPIVQTLHNFRLLCPQALLLRDGRVCEDCVGRVPWRGVVHGCYRGSRVQTAVLAFANTAHRAAGTWRNKVSRYIALNEFARRKYIEGGLPAERIAVKANFVDLPPSEDGPRNGLLFVGRLSPEKGIRTLLDVADGLPCGEFIRVLGTGPMQAQVHDHPRIEYLGAQPPEEVYRWMRRSALLLVPSIWYENFPRTIVEAFACGLPVVASRLGALPELVFQGKTGWLVEPADAIAWQQTIRTALARAEGLIAMGRAARAHYEANWAADSNLEQLLAIYAQACQSP